MEKPKTENLTAWITGRNLNIYQKADAVIEHNKLLEYVSDLENQSTSQKETIERLREGLMEFKKRCHHNMLSTISKADRKGWKENFEDCEQLLNTTEPIDQ